MRIGIIAALPGELKPLVKGWDRLPAAKGSGIQMWQRSGADEVVAVCAGMGAAAARRAFSAVEFGGAMDLVCSVGWAGATTEKFAPGATVLIAEVIDAQTGERFSSSGEETAKVRLVTTAHVANVTDKRRLWASYEAGMVDMEAATVARLAQMRGIPFYCIKAVSDEHDADLPDLNPFIDADGAMKMGAFLSHVAVRPGYWPGLARLGRNSSGAAKELAKTIRGWLEDVLPTSDGRAV